MRVPLVLAILLLPVAAAGILPPSDLPVLDATGGARHGWAAWRVTTDGRPFVVEIEALDVPYPEFVVIDLMDAQGTTLGHALTGGLRGDDGATADFPRLGVHVSQLSSLGPGASGLSVRFNDAGPALVGEFVIAAWTSGEARAWDAALRGDDGTKLLAATHGDATWMLSSRDFATTAGASAGTLGASAHAAAGSFALASHATLLGFFGGLYPGPWALTMDAPSGSALCPCEMYNATALPGAYAFHLTGADAGIEGLDEAYLAVADVAIP